ncbi:Uncharacterized conserved protein, DUF1330 family [Arboricoccus pini]|uniref:Uncharacterized conserved protein, DUF1330 family n=1 Tax=Arboricoccus pini TaxID=1963835 RepID=A0A212QQQ6_9PROT|nr:DUF1330 domain-containing protein [Arboricoccus pini]SNB61663.1 Uncharacterized conserved protein, DUF1330 family [Arboricoccus pini]
MTKAYWLAQVDVADAEAYKAYITANAVAFRKYGARFLVRSGTARVVEGQARGRTVVIEFPDIAAANACYGSPEYQAAIALRRPVSTADVLIVEGYDGPQPADRAAG